jgi:uracil-DNA glycosylase
VNGPSLLGPRNDLPTTLEEARACTVCVPRLPFGARPLVAAHPDARILIIGQAPGRAAHQACIPWQDRSGDRLRSWLGVSREQFYDPTKIALVPMGFCFPGTGRHGDLEPRPECAPLWHPRILPLLQGCKVTIYLGRFAFTRYLADQYETLSEAVADFQNLLPRQIALPHPSPRTGIWVKQRPWFADTLLPILKTTIKKALRS